MSPIGEHQSHSHGQLLQLYNTGASGAPAHGAGAPAEHAVNGGGSGVAATAGGSGGGDDTASVASSYMSTAISMAAGAEERLSRIESMLDKLAKAQSTQAQPQGQQ
jgi:hypothetical protein